MTPEELRRHAGILEDYAQNCPAEIDGGPGIEESLWEAVQALREAADRLAHLGIERDAAREQFDRHVEWASEREQQARAAALAGLSPAHLAALAELADDLESILQEVSGRDGDATARQHARAEAVRAALAMVESMERHHRKPTIESMLRSALVGIIGVDGKDDLEQMEAFIRSAPAPAADKAASIDAIHALLATLPGLGMGRGRARQREGA